MEAGELSMENMETLTELGDELTLGDIDGERRGRVPHTGQAEGRENIVSCMLSHNGCSVTSTSYSASYTHVCATHGQHAAKYPWLVFA